MKALIERVLGGELEAFRQIVQEYGPAVRAFLASRLPGQAQDVDDLAQETFIAAYERLAAFDPERGELGAWLHGIARHKLNMHLRRHYTHANALEKLRASLALLLEPDVAAGGEPVPDDILRLRTCLQKLPAHLRAIFHARYFETQRVQHIAKSLAKSETAVSNALFHGRQQLRQCLEASR